MTVALLLKTTCMRQLERLLSSYSYNHNQPQYTDSLQITSLHQKIAMNKQCTCLFIIISIHVYYKSEYIPTVTSFASILVNCFYFLQKMTAQRSSVLNFRGRFVKFCKKSSGQSKMALLVTVTKNGSQNLM